MPSQEGFAKVLKFGGSSMGSPESIQSVIRIIKNAYEENPHIGVVVSAFVGSTDQLISLGKTAALGDDYQEDLDTLISRHIHTAHELVPAERLFACLAVLDGEFNELKGALEGISLIKDLSSNTLDFLMSFGERLSACILSESLEIPEAKFVDARKLIKTDRNFGNAAVDFALTNQNIQNFIRDNPCLPILPGFIGSSQDGEATTLGRGGSDYSAAILGAALQAAVIEIWTDVSGMYTADPRKEPNARPIAELSYQEAMEMSYFGAKVIHPPTIVPACEKKIPIAIKNTFDPDAAGTLIQVWSSNNSSLICGISSISDVSLICLQGGGMVGVCGIAERLFGALAQKKINVILISQGSSEHSICLAVSPSSVKIAKEAIEKEFALELGNHLIDEISIKNNLSVVAVVGENMRQKPGIAGKLFSALEKKNINVVAIVQGSSELNISFVVKKEDEVKAVRGIHEAFFSFSREALHVFLVGAGLIGSTLLEQMQSQVEALQKEHDLDIRLVGVANSRQMQFNPQGIPIEKWESFLSSASEKMDIKAFISRMKHLKLQNSVFVD